MRRDRRRCFRICSVDHGAILGGRALPLSGLGLCRGNGRRIVPIRNLARTDPEISAVTFKNHLDRLWGTGRPSRWGWVRNDVDALHTLVTLPAKRPGGEIDPYYFRLGAEYYDAAPPTVALVQPDGITHAPQASRWFPVL